MKSKISLPLHYYILNLVVSFLVAGLTGILIYLPTMINYNMFYDIVACDRKSMYVLFCIIVSAGIIGVYFERADTNNKIVSFFQRSIKRKLILLLVVMFCIWGYLYIRVKVRFRYMSYGYQIVSQVVSQAQNGVSNITVDIPSSIKYLIVTEQYELSEKDLLSTGIISKKLARSISTERVITEGTYLYLVGKSRTLAIVAFPLEFSTISRFLITTASGKVTFRICHNRVKDKFGKMYNRYIIDGFVE